VLDPALAVDARELLVPVFSSIAQSRLGDADNAPAPLIGVAQLMGQDRLQLSNDAVSSRLKELLGLLQAGCILRIERICFLQKVIDEPRFASRKSLDQFFMLGGEHPDIGWMAVFGRRLHQTLASVFRQKRSRLGR
jgi:hypothetical protein